MWNSRTNWIKLQNDFYKYFWNKNPALQNAKKGIDQVKDEIRKLQELKQLLIKKQTQFKVVRNSLKEENLPEMAKRYKIEPIWILKANGVEKTDELKDKDSIIIPTHKPPGIDD